jgi:crotonobetainyl-CoA:carnitine CoA-transferase CaiB-like acyl-CoA transferase
MSQALLAGVMVAVRAPYSAAGEFCVGMLEHLGASVDREPAGASDGHAAIVVGQMPAQPGPDEAGGRRASILGQGKPHAPVEVIFEGDERDCVIVQQADASLDHPAVVALAGAHAAVAALAALRLALRESRPIVVRVRALEVLATCLGEVLLPAICPNDRAVRRNALAIVACADGYVGISAPTPVHRAHLAALTGADAVHDPEAELDEVLRSWLAGRTRDEIFHEAQLWQLPVVPVLSPSEAQAEEQSVARNAGGRETADGWRATSPFRVTRSKGPLASASRPAEGAPLAGVEVLDLGRVWAGPYCGRLLAELGASVTRIEGPRQSDATRRAGDGGCAGVVSDLNRGKRSLTLDLDASDGRESFLELASKADVVLENFSPRVMPNFGLDAATLQSANASLISLSLPAFGSTGPWASYVAYGSGLELVSGLATTGADGRPSPARVPYLDYLAGAYGAAAVLAALIARDADGRGSRLEIAQRDVALEVLAFCHPEAAAEGSPVKIDNWWTRDPSLAAVAQDDSLTLHREASAAYGDVDAERLVGGLRELDPDLLGNGEPGGTCAHFARMPWLIEGAEPPGSSREEGA